MTVVLAALAGGLLQAVPARAAFLSGGELEWSMPDRYQDVDDPGVEPLRDDLASRLDPNEDGLPDNSAVAPTVVTPATWRVHLDACSFAATSEIREYRWRVTEETGPREWPTSTCETDVDLATLGREYPVEVRMTDADYFTMVASTTATPRDFLVVAMGDSYGSGEGNPERVKDESYSPFDALTIFYKMICGDPVPTACIAAGVLNTVLQLLSPVVGGVEVAMELMMVHDWEGGPTDAWGPALRSSPATWANRRCHRSGFSGQAQAAAALERDDPHSSVTFLHVACSGALLGDLQPGPGGPDPKKGGILTPYDGAEPPGGVLPLPSQIEQVQKLIGMDAGKPRRVIDSLLVSIGGNDMGFADVITACLASVDCHVDDDKENGGRGIYYNGLATLPTGYDVLADALRDDLGLGAADQQSNVILSGYPDILRNEQDQPCKDVFQFEPIAGSSLMEDDEAYWASNIVGTGLNNVVRDSASHHSWRFVEMLNGLRGTDASGDPVGHGYCAGELSWMRTIAQSVQLQGNYKGGFHPNRFGHQAYQRAYYSSANGLHALLLPTPNASGAVAAGSVCAPELLSQWQELEHFPDALGFRKALGEDPEITGRGYQGIQRLPGPGGARFLMSRSGVSSLQFTTPQPGRLVWAKLASKASAGERIGSNRRDPKKATEDTPPPTGDRVDNFVLLDGTSGFPAYAHAGGLQISGSVAVVGLEQPLDPSDSPGALLFLDAKTGRPLSTVRVDYPAAWAAVAAGTAAGSGLLVLAGEADRVHAYRATGSPGAPGFALTEFGSWSAASAPSGSWPGGNASPQSGSLLMGCDGSVYLLTTRNTSGDPVVGPATHLGGDDVANLWRVETTTGALTPVSQRTFTCYWRNGTALDLDPVTACSFAAGAGATVSPNGELLLYGVDASDQGPDGSIEMAEFSNAWGFRRGGPAFTPTARLTRNKATVLAGESVDLDASRSRAPIARARVSLYQDEGFTDRRVTLEGADPEKWTDLSQVDRTDSTFGGVSSVRWIAPAGCVAKLADDANTGTGRRLVADGERGCAASGAPRSGRRAGW